MELRGVRRPAAAADRTGPHNAVCRAIRDYLALQGAFTAKLAGGAYQEPGLPDLIALIPRRDGVGSVFLACEVKTGSGELNPRQRAVRDRMERAGGWYILARDVQDVIDAVEAAGLARCPVLR